MAKLTKPATGQTTLPASYRTQLDPVFASTWSAPVQGASASASSAIVSPSGEAAMSGNEPLFTSQFDASAAQSVSAPTMTNPWIVEMPDLVGISSTSFNTSTDDLYEAITACGQTPMAVSCGAYESNPPASISDCHRLIDMMATADGFRRTTLLAASHHGDRIDYLIP